MRDLTAPTANAGTLPWINFANASRATTATGGDANGPSFSWTGAGLTFSPSNTLNTSISAAADGTYTATLTVTDAAGNVKTSNLTANRDRVNPTISAFNINSNATYTNTTVTLNTTAADTGTSGLYQMQFSNDGGGSWSTLQSYLSSRTGWALAAGADGSRTVYARVTDGAGNTSSNANDSIVLDVTPPVVSVFTVGSGNPTYTSSASVTLYITATDATSGVYQSRYGNLGLPWGPWEAYAATKAWSFPDTKGVHRVYLGVTDNAGNATALNSISDSIINYARIRVTFSSLTITDDSDVVSFPISEGSSGEILYEFRIDGATMLLRSSPLTITSTATISTSLPPTTTPILLKDPTAGSLTIDGYLVDEDTSPVLMSPISGRARTHTLSTSMTRARPVPSREAPRESFTIRSMS